MREILFRGKRIINGDWTSGGFHSRFDRAFIIGCSKSLMIDGVEVIPETVGQYTGLTDKNGKRIFEGDIVREIFSYPKTYAVKFDKGRGGWYPFACGDGCGCCEIDTRSPSFIEVIGNIHDNPELIAEVEG